jgi:hypothetical protein
MGEGLSRRRGSFAATLVAEIVRFGPRALVELAIANADGPGKNFQLNSTQPSGSYRSVWISPRLQAVQQSG